jgi:hypothetical protein
MCPTSSARKEAWPPAILRLVTRLPALETTGGVGPELDDMTLTKAVETKPDQISRVLARRAGRGLLPLLVDDRLPIVGVWVLGRSHGATITILSTALLGRKRRWAWGGGHRAAAMKPEAG